MQIKNLILLSLAVLLYSISIARAQSYADFANGGKIILDNTTTSVPGSTAVNVWNGSFAVDSNGVVSGSGTVRSFANKALNSKATNFIILNISRLTGIQTTNETSSYGDPNYLPNDTNLNPSYGTQIITTSTADFNATAQIGIVNGKKAVLAQFKGVVFSEKSVTYATNITFSQNYTTNAFTTNYYTNSTISTQYTTRINGVVFGPAPQMGGFGAYAYTNTSGSF